ncbi:SDR family oxidoreductase [Candidatus Curtissbacteria bacterium]|nr:SDR family oxidoreductase [Candidatus Curtissbacteria bacterium]
MKVAIVTGSAKGLGAAVVRHLAADGYTVVIHYNKSKAPAEKLLAEVKKSSPQSIIVSGNVTTENDVAQIVKKVLEEFGQIDLLVNNVGNFIFKPFEKTTNAEFREMIESNLYSALYMSRAVLPAMRKQKSGNIINIGAVGAERLIIRENSTPYFLGKTAAYVLTKAMARTEAKHGIRINMVSPGSMAADIFEVADFPSGRPAVPADVIKAIAFLISPQNSYINGANIEVAGGFIPGF